MIGSLSQFLPKDNPSPGEKFEKGLENLSTAGLRQAAYKAEKGEFT
jgi:hypothetical protein